MRFKRRLFLYCAGAIGISIVAQVGLLFCFFSYTLVGKYIYSPFYWLSNWPNMLFQPLFPKTLPDWLEGFGWPLSCLISLIGWVMLAGFVAIIIHVLSLSRSQNRD
jgi:hypothetical protein